ncbi:MAG: tetratricopeptide repeat protein [Planctomycetota bacterium]
MRLAPFIKFVFALAAVAATSGCTLWDPDYEPDPDQYLQDLLSPLEDRDAKLDAPTRDRLRFAVERLATRHPGHVPSQVAASALAMESGEPQRAQTYVDRALSLEPGNVEARCMRVRIAVADGSLDLARKLVDDGLRIRPDSFHLYESSAWLHQLNVRFDEAMRALDAAETLGAPAWRIAFHRGLVEELGGDSDAAVGHYRAAIDHNDECEPARQRLAGLLMKREIGGR